MKGRTGDEDLMRYFDGELDPRESRSVEERAAGSPEDQARLDGLAEVREAVQAHYEAAADDAGDRLAGMWDRLEEQLGEPERAEAPERETVGWLAAVRTWLAGPPGYALAGAVGAVAGVLLILSIGRPEKIKVVEVERRVPVVVKDTNPNPPVPVVPARAQGTEVESLEVAGGTGTIFQIPGAHDDEAATTVIWITKDEQAGSEGPI